MTRRGSIPVVVDLEQGKRAERVRQRRRRCRVQIAAVEIGEPLDFTTETAAQARDMAKAERPGAIVRKIKVVKEASQ